MSSEVTPEMCYAEWHFHIMSAKGITPKRVKNFDKAREKKDWVFFEKLAMLCNRNAGGIDHTIFIRSLAEHYDGYIQPKDLATMKAIKIYKSYVRCINLENDPEAIEQSILDSFSFVTNYMYENGLTSLNQYIFENANIIPTILKHYNAGSICIHFLCCIKNFNDMLIGYPKDVVDEFLPDFSEKYRKYRPRLMASDKKSVVVCVNNLDLFIKRGLERRISG